MELPGFLERAWALLRPGEVSEGGRRCPVCRKRFRRFLSAGRKRREDARCPGCGSLERHRFVWAFFERETNLFDGLPKRMLHVAPERALEARLRRSVGAGYLTADLRARAVQVQMNICDIQYPDDTFDVIFCSHVLEHVPDDRRAMREFNRVLKPAGWAVLQVPIAGELTVEDLGITDPVERKRRYGHPGHVRTCGVDYGERLRAAGLEVRVVTTKELFDTEEIVGLGLARASERGERLFFCRKGRPAAP